MAADPYRYFRIEAAELHAELGQGVLDLERGEPPPDLVPRLLRQAHTLKGAARVVKQREIADHAHAFEDALAPIQEAKGAAPRAQIDLLLQILDGIGARVAALTPAAQAQAQAQEQAQAQASAPAATAATAAPPAPAPTTELFRTVRANVEEMDALLHGIGEAHIQLGVVRRSQSSLEHARHLIDVLADQLSSPRGREVQTSLAHELQTLLASLERGFASGVDQLDQELRQVRDAAEHMRLVPAGALFTSLERAVRDVAQAQGKSVVFEGRGGDVRLDAHVLGVVQGALLQLVRNAVAHGVEAPADRGSAGKTTDARVVVEVSRRGRRAAFTCSDDGRGVDLEAVKLAAQRKGILAGGPDAAEELSAEKLLDLLLRGRLSTSGTVTELSGRGIGLDLLREAAERLRGEVSFVTERGQGTKVELVVPLSLASLGALMVEAGGATVAIPLDAVRRTTRIARADVARTAHGESVVHEGTVIPFVPLARVLTARAVPHRDTVWSAVIVQAAAGMAAVGVERLLGTATVIQRPLPELAPSTPVVGGASIDAAGNPRLVLDPDGLVAAALGAGLLPERPVARRHRILVVDDSMTTRMLEQSILESAGYDVDLATSGEEALEKVHLALYSLYLVDVEMPGMDGFTFIEQTRADPMTRDVPAILVTSRNAPEDRRRGQAVGAKGYIVKGELDQNDLLARIRKLVM